MRNYIGRNNLLGRLRYWYYKKRGWVSPGGFYFKKKRVN